MTWWNLLLWTFFAFGVLIPFGIKFANHMLKTEPGRFSFTVNTLKFLFDDVKVATTTVTTMVAELVLGAIYIDKLAIPLTGYLAELPKHPILSLLLGLLSETITPWLLNILMSAMSKKEG